MRVTTDLATNAVAAVIMLVVLAWAGRRARVPSTMLG